MYPACDKGNSARSRIRQGTGYQPAHDTERAAADYIAWLHGGNER